MKAALVVIDVQRALCTGQYAAFEASRVIERINEILERARDAGVPVILIQHESRGGALDYGTDGWQLAESLNILPSDIFVRKTATDSFHKSELQAVLQRHEIQSLVICGFQSEFCVDTTTRRALGLGYPVILVSDGHTRREYSLMPGAKICRHHNVTLRSWTRRPDGRQSAQSGEDSGGLEGPRGL